MEGGPTAEVSKLIFYFCANCLFSLNPSLWLVVVPVILYDRPTPPPSVGGEGLSKPSPGPYYTSQLLGLVFPPIVGRSLAINQKVTAFPLSILDQVRSMLHGLL